MGIHGDRRVVAVALVGALAFAGCGSGEGGDTATATTLDEASTTPAKEPDSIVFVSSRGTLPRREMRLHLTAGQKHTAQLTMVTSADGAVVGQALKPYRNTLSVTATVTVVEVLADSGARLSMHYDAADLTGDTARTPAFDRAVSQLQGLTGTMAISPRGHTTDIALDTASIADADVRATLHELALVFQYLLVPFPAQPVGPGAEWSLTMDVPSGGVLTKTTIKARLAEATADGYRVDVSNTQRGVPGPARPPNAGSATVTLEALDASGTGSYTGTLASPVAQSTMQSSGTMALLIEEKGITGRANQRLESTVEVRAG